MERGLRFALEESTWLGFYSEKHGKFWVKGLHTGFPLAVDCGKGHEGAPKYEEVGERKGEALPVDFEHGCKTVLDSGQCKAGVRHSGS